MLSYISSVVTGLLKSKAEIKKQYQGLSENKKKGQLIKEATPSPLKTVQTQILHSQIHNSCRRLNQSKKSDRIIQECIEFTNRKSLDLKQPDLINSSLQTKTKNFQEIFRRGYRALSINRQCSSSYRKSRFEMTDGKNQDTCSDQLQQNRPVQQKTVIKQQSGRKTRVRIQVKRYSENTNNIEKYKKDNFSQEKDGLQQGSQNKKEERVYCSQKTILHKRSVASDKLDQYQVLNNKKVDKKSEAVKRVKFAKTQQQIFVCDQIGREQIQNSMKNVAMKTLDQIESSYCSNIQDQQNPSFQEQIERKLDQIIEFSIKSKSELINQLQQLLYGFKQQFKVINDKLEIKWRIMMAHCKQKRSLFQRAIVLYQQILTICKTNPDALIICKGDIYHKLGIFYTETQQWNKAIVCFKNSLCIFKQKVLIQKYAQNINNLGRLYLLAGNTIQAEKYLVYSFQIKKKYFNPVHHSLLSTLTNLFQCHLQCRNFQQAQKILNSLAYISNQQWDHIYLKAGLLRKKAKLCFFQGNLSEVQTFLTKSEQILKIISEDTFTYSLQYAQISNLRGLLSLQYQNYQKAKDFLQIAGFVYQGYYSKNHIIQRTVKKNIETVQAHLMVKRGSNNKL